jgi:hypothetical protein
VKTFQEACLSTFACPLPDDTGRSRLQAVIKLAADAGRWREIEEEIRQSPPVQAYIDSIVALHDTGHLSLEDCLMATFIQATTVGIEMETNHVRIGVVGEEGEVTPGK